MTSITVRNVPDETRDELAARAAARGWSLQEFVLHELQDLVARPDATRVLAEIRERKHATRSRLSADVILAHLAADRR